MNKEHKKLERLMLFSEVAQHLSFTLAADSLGISRGHLSAQVRQLEKDMGMPLLVRSTRSVRLTQEGARVLAGMEKIRDSLLALERNAKLEGQEVEGVIKLTSPALFTERYLLDIFSQFKALHPKVEFSVDVSYTSYDLNRTDFDMAFRSTNTPPLNMIVKPVLEYEHRCCASPDYLKRHGRPQTIHELREHPCLRGEDLPHWKFTDTEMYVDGWLTINDNNLLKRLGVMGQGIIRVPKYFVEAEVARGELEYVLENQMPPGRMIYMVYPQLIHQSKRLSTFIEFTLGYFKQHFNA